MCVFIIYFTFSLKYFYFQKQDFPNGFYVVFVMHGDDSRCQRYEDDGGSTQPLLYEYDTNLDNDRTKMVTFVIHEKITDIEYLSAIFGTSGIFAFVYLFVFIVSCTYSCRYVMTYFSL